MTKKILIVDDEESILELERAILEAEGYNVISANNGQDCLKILQKEKPDFILMDMMMPGMSGRETTEKIRANPKTKNLKIAFLTVARFSEVGKKELDKLNVVDYITKPFDNEELLKKIKKHVS